MSVSVENVVQHRARLQTIPYGADVEIASAAPRAEESSESSLFRLTALAPNKSRRGRGWSSEELVEF
jgi:hypothetical protein